MIQNFAAYYAANKTNNAGLLHFRVRLDNNKQRLNQRLID